MLIMGVDPGSRVTGFGLVSAEGNRLKCEGYGTIRASTAGSGMSISERLKKVFIELSGILDRFGPDIVAVESVFHAINVRSALTLGHVRGVVLLAVATRNLPLVEYSPLEVKKAVAGYGRADKQQVQTMVATLLNLKEIPEPHDASDALAVALCRAFAGTLGPRKQRRWRTYEVPGR